MKSKKESIMSWYSTKIVVAILLTSLYLSLITKESATARPVIAIGKIAFSKLENDQTSTSIYVINADGTNLKRLTHTGKDTDPSWSPDGEQLMYTSTRQQALQIYVMDSNGERQRPLTDDDNGDYQPDWSSDGKTVVFTSHRDNKDKEIYLMDADGLNQRRLTNSPEADYFPTFSPDGKKIAFLSFRDGAEPHLYVMNADGTGIVRLFPDPVSPRKPSWSPDGRFIAFTRFSGWNQTDVYRINADGTNSINLTNHPAFDGNPTWSPDGKQIAFSREERDSKGIYLMNADGTDVIKLTSIMGVSLDWYGPENFTVTPRQKNLTMWGWIKEMFLK